MTILAEITKALMLTVLSLLSLVIIFALITAPARIKKEKEEEQKRQQIRNEIKEKLNKEIIKMLEESKSEKQRRNNTKKPRIKKEEK